MLVLAANVTISFYLRASSFRYSCAILPFASPMSQDLLKDSRDFEHGRLVGVSTHSRMSPVFLDELEVGTFSQDLVQNSRTYKNNIALTP